MSKKKKMNGGLLLNETHESKTIEAAIEFFKSNSTFSILTNSSIACITFKAVLKDEFESPFIHIRSGIIEKPVRTLLFKYFPINTLNDELDLAFETDQPRSEDYDYIQLAQISEIKKEYNLQLEIYQKTYNTISSAYEPVCPYPIHCFTDLDKDETITEIIAKLNNTDPKKESNILIITDTLGGAIGTDDDAKISYTTKNGARFKEDGSNARELITTLGCIVMEFMDDFTTLREYSRTALEDDYKKAKSLVAYEAIRLQHIGIVHGDIHLSNIMYNPNYKYITNKDDEHKGRALIIDFGKSRKLEKDVIEKYTKALTEENKLVTIYQWSEYPFYFIFSEPYTFNEIYRRRLEVTLEFRKTMIQDLESLLTTSPLSTAERKKKAQLKLDLITNLKLPTNFAPSKVDDFEKEEFDTPFKEVKDSIFKTSNKENSTLSKERITKITERITELEGKAKKALVDLTYLINKFTILFSLTPPAHGGGRYIHSHKKQNAFANRLHKTTLKVKRSKRSKRSKRKQ